MQNGSKTEINYALALYKERGAIQFDKVLSIPSNQRITALVKDLDGRIQVSAALTASIKSAFDVINLRIGLSPEQMVQLAEQIIDESEEDNLALEDVLLFLQQLIAGKSGKIYDRMDIPTFFELFENYRQERWENLLKIKEEQHSQNKISGDDGTRASDNKDRDKELHRSALGDYLRKQFPKQSDNEPR